MAMVLSACAPRATQTVGHAVVFPTERFTGVVRFEARHPTPSGASQSVELRPARYIEVVALDAHDRVLATGFTDERGRFTLDAPRETTVFAARAKLSHDGHTVVVSPTGDDTVIHTLRVNRPREGNTIELVARETARDGVSGALHLADTAYRGVSAAKEWTGRTLPTLIIYWGRGVTTEWSYYRGERPVGSGKYLLELLGGPPGQQATADTDEHDEGIVLHEVGHFVMDLLSTNSSDGGSHPTGVLVDPGLAWEEGRATWFSSAVRHDPRYQDTIGLEPGGSLRVDHDLEHPEPGPMGLGSEATVASVLWDLTDGAEGYTDTDNDGVALGPAAVMRAMMAQREDPAAYPAIDSILYSLTVNGQNNSVPAVTPTALTAMLRTTHQPESLLRGRAEDLWPANFSVPGAIDGKIDGLTNPAPSGGRARPSNGFDAVKVFRVRMTTRGWLHLELSIDGLGLPADQSDVDLELRDHRAELIASARGTTARETLGRLLAPGYYYVYVRDGGGGNRADWTLRARVNPVQ